MLNDTKHTQKQKRLMMISNNYEELRNEPKETKTSRKERQNRYKKNNKRKKMNSTQIYGKQSLKSLRMTAETHNTCKTESRDSNPHSKSGVYPHHYSLCAFSWDD